jgi:hypothetical protein
VLLQQLGLLQLGLLQLGLLQLGLLLSPLTCWQGAGGAADGALACGGAGGRDT